MQRHEMIDAMRTLGLKGMASAFDEAVIRIEIEQRLIELGFILD